MKSLVTGGAGFIGSHLTSRLLSLGHDVIVVDNFKRGNKLGKETSNHIQLVEGDVKDEDTILRVAKSCDYIFHFAAVLGVDIVADNPVETMETEFLGLKNVVKAAIRNSTDKIIYASTSGVYGKAAIKCAVKEDFTVSPSSSYAISKRFNEIYLKSLYQEKGLESVSIRFFNVYGPKQDNRMVIPRLIDQALSNRKLTVYGDGNQTRDFTYIDQVIESVIQIAQKVHGCEIINVSNNFEYSIRQVAEIIIDLTDSDSKIDFVNPTKDRYDFEVERRFGSSEKLKRLTGYYPDMDLREGIKNILSYEDHSVSDEVLHFYRRKPSIDVSSFHQSLSKDSVQTIGA